MKITKIIIPDNQQFQNFELELTYPELHAKAGKPLDKICFIGRNGTGKSTILQTIANFLSSFENPEDDFDFEQLIIQILFNDKKYFVLPQIETIDNSDIEEKIVYLISAKIEEKKDWVSDLLENELNTTEFENLYKEYIAERFTLAEFKQKVLKNAQTIFSPAESHKNLLLEIDKTPKTDVNEALELFKIQPDFHYISNETVNEFWKYLVFLLKKRDDDFKLFLEANQDETYKQLKQRFEELQPSILKTLAEIWNLILDKTGLFFDFRNANNPVQLNDNLLVYIKLKNTDETIPYNRLSTGIRNFIFRIGHILALNFNRKIENSFLLIDEPENSLFPDFLYDIVTLYRQAAPNSQFFTATHSPLIAAQFEPCERVILDFAYNSKVTARKGQSPEGIDPNNLLQVDFEVRNILGKAAIDKWNEFVDIKQRLKFETSENKKKQLFDQYLKLGKIYNF